mgnify:CR=1 FL=1
MHFSKRGCAHTAKRVPSFEKPFFLRADAKLGAIFIMGRSKALVNDHSWYVESLLKRWYCALVQSVTVIEHHAEQHIYAISVAPPPLPYDGPGVNELVDATAPAPRRFLR